MSKNDKIITRNRVYIGYPLLLSLSLILGLVSNKFIALILMLGVRLSMVMRFTILDRYTNMEFESKYRATAISALNMFVSVVYILVVLVSGKIQDLYSTKLIYSLLGIFTALIAFPSGISLVKEYNNYRIKNNLKK